jgi:hypothetical protein
MEIRAAARTVQLHGREFLTPLIVPSFSSRAKPPTPVLRFLQETLPAIGGPILISAYDVAHEPPDPETNILSEVARASLSFVLLDSGGYEVLWNERAADAGLITAGSAPAWSLDRYQAVLDGWPADLPLLAVSWDAPNTNIEHQVEAATDLAAGYPERAIELLLKPTQNGFDFSEIVAVAPALSRFPVVGVTEAEIGESMASRLRSIANLRETLDDCGIQIPIHVFGGLDPRMTPLYHAAGADVFDGLSWLRYAYQGEQGVYDKSFVAIHSPRDVENDQIWDMRARNTRFLVDLQIKMSRFQVSQDFAVLGSVGELLKGAWEESWRD